MSSEQVIGYEMQSALWAVGVWNIYGNDYAPYINLESEILEGINLHGVSLRYANFIGANLKNADLSYANLWGANLELANLWGANLQGANFWGANLSGTKVLYIPAIGSSRKDNIYASPIYTDGRQTGWGWHLGCYYADNFKEARVTVNEWHGEGTYTRCMDMLYELCLMVFNPNEKDNSND